MVPLITAEIQATPTTIYLANVMRKQQLIADVQQVQNETQHSLLIHLQSDQELSRTLTELLENCRSTREEALNEPALAAIFTPIVENLQSTDTTVRLKAVEKLKDLGRQSS